MKNRNKKCFIVLFILSIIAILMVIYKIKEKQTTELIFENAVIDIPEDTPDADQAVHILEKTLVNQMPECRITKLYVDDRSPLIQTYEKKEKKFSCSKWIFISWRPTEQIPLSHISNMKAIPGHLPERMLLNIRCREHKKF